MAAPAELHGSKEALKAIKATSEEFAKDEYIDNITTNFTDWKASLRAGLWSPFENRLMSWIKKQVKEAEATDITDNDWKPKWTEILVCLEEATQPDCVSKAIDLANRVKVLHSDARAKA